jgi:protein-L-isoaspartate(D-aspartate) O-methyltransferase
MDKINYAQARRTMVATQVRPNDVVDLALQKTLEAVPREKFLPEALRPLAYVEQEIAYAPGRRLLTPRDFAKLVAAAGPERGDLVLDVACGSGYSTAVLAALCEMVVGVESDEQLAATAQDALSAIGVGNAAVIVADPASGAPKQGPYDLIFIGAAIETEPAALFAQLKEGGRLAAILLADGVARGVVYRKSGGAMSARTLFDATARAVLPGFAAPRRFRF